MVFSCMGVASTRASSEAQCSAVQIFSHSSTQNAHFWHEIGTHSSRNAEDGQADAISSWRVERWSFLACGLLPPESAVKHSALLCRFFHIPPPKMRSFGMTLGLTAPEMWRMDKQTQPAAGGRRDGLFLHVGCFHQSQQ